MDSDGALLARYKATRDAEAFAALADRYARIVFGAALRITGNRHDAEEVTQECFLALARQAGAVRSSVPGWLHALAVSRAKDFMRGKQRRTKLENAPEAQRMNMNENPETAWAALAPQVDDAIAELPDELREAILLHFLQGKSQAEIAAQEGVNQSTVSRRIEKAVDALCDNLRKRGIPVAAALLAGLLAARASEAAPATLMAGLGKMAASGVGAPATWLGAKTVVSIAAGLLVSAGVGLVIIHAYVPEPTPSPPAVAAATTSTTAPAAVAAQPSVPRVSLLPGSAPQPPATLATAGKGQQEAPRPPGETGNTPPVALAPAAPVAIAPPGPVVPATPAVPSAQDPAPLIPDPQRSTVEELRALLTSAIELFVAQHYTDTPEDVRGLIITAVKERALIQGERRYPDGSTWNAHFVYPDGASHWRKVDLPSAAALAQRMAEDTQPFIRNPETFYARKTEGLQTKAVTLPDGRVAPAPDNTFIITGQARTEAINLAMLADNMLAKWAGATARHQSYRLSEGVPRTPGTPAVPVPDEQRATTQGAPRTPITPTVPVPDGQRATTEEIRALLASAIELYVTQHYTDTPEDVRGQLITAVRERPLMQMKLVHDDGSSESAWNKVALPSAAALAQRMAEDTQPRIRNPETFYARKIEPLQNQASHINVIVRGEAGGLAMWAESTLLRWDKPRQK